MDASHSSCGNNIKLDNVDIVVIHQFHTWQPDAISGFKFTFFFFLRDHSCVGGLSKSNSCCFYRTNVKQIVFIYLFINYHFSVWDHLFVQLVMQLSFAWSVSKITRIRMPLIAGSVNAFARLNIGQNEIWSAWNEWPRIHWDCEIASSQMNHKWINNKILSLYLK